MDDKNFAQRYRLDRVVHRGTLGTLYLAEQISLKRTVLLRIVSKELTADLPRRQRLMSRLESLSRADDQTLVPIFDVGDMDGQPFYAMERCDGIDIKSAVHGDHQLFQGPNAPDLETRVKALREFLKSCRKLGETHLDLAHLRPGDVLLVSPFRFALAEPGIASECGNRPPKGMTSLREVLECAFAITFDPSWDGKEVGGARRSPLAMRSSAFHGLSNATSEEPNTLVDQALESLRSLEHSSASRQSAMRSGSFNSRSSLSKVRKLTTRIFTVVCPILLCSTGLGFYAYSRHLSTSDEAERAMQNQFNLAVRNSDRVQLEALAAGGQAVPEHLVLQATKELALKNEEQFDMFAEEALAELLDPAVENSQRKEPQTRRRTESFAPELEHVRATIRNQVQQDENSVAIRTAFSFEDPNHGDALQQMLLKDVHPALRRAMLMRMIADPKPGVARIAGAALAAGVGGHPRHLDEPLSKRLLDPKCDPGVTLALIGYFSGAPRNVGVPLLTKLVRQPEERPLAQNPNRNPFLVRLYQSLNLSADLLRTWIGPAYFDNDQPDMSPRPISLRAAALFALEKENLDPDRALALHKELSGNGMLGEVMARQTLRHAGRFTDEQLLEQLRSATHRIAEGMDFRAINTLLEVLTKRAPQSARAALLEALEDRSISPERVGELFLAAIRHGLIANIDDLADFLVQLPLDASESVTALARGSPDLRKILTETGSRSGKDPHSTRLALLRCQAGLGSPSDVELLRVLVESSAGSAWLRMQALLAMRHTDQPRALTCIQSVIEMESYPRDMRILAMEIASQKLGTQGSIRTYLTLRPSIDNNTSQTDLLRSLGKTLTSSEDPTLRLYAASVLDGYGHEIVDANFAELLDPVADSGLISWAAYYFSQRTLPPETLSELEPKMEALLSDEDVEEATKSYIIRCLTLNKCTSFSGTISTLLPDLGSNAAAEAALDYLAEHVGKPEVDAALLEYVESPQSLDTRMRALEALCTPMLRGQPGNFAMVQKIMAESKEFAIAFGCASVLLKNDEKMIPMDILAKSYVIFLRRSAAGSSNSSDDTSYYYQEMTAFGSPRVVLEVRDPELTRQLVEEGIDNDLRDGALAQLASTVLVRVAKMQEDPANFARLLKEQGYTVPEMLTALGWSNRPTTSYISKFSNDTDMLKSSDIRAALDFLCGDSQKSTQCPESYLARAMLLRSTAYDSDSRSSREETRSRQELLGQATLDLRAAIKLTQDDSVQAQLQLELFELQKLQLDDEGALTTLLQYREAQSQDDESLHQLFDQYMDMGRREDAKRLLDQFQTRNEEYWERSFRFHSHSEEDLVAHLDGVSLLPDWNDERVFQLLPTAMRYVFDLGTDPRLADVRKRATDRMQQALMSEFPWARRAIAAFHLGWLAPTEHADLLVRAARTDAHPIVKKHALLGVLATNPKLAAQVAHEFLQSGVPDLLLHGYWVLVRCGDQQRTEFLRQRLVPKASKELLALCIELAVADDQAELIPQITSLFTSEHQEIRALSATALGYFAQRGHVVDQQILLDRFRHEESPTVAMASGSALAFIGNREVLSDCIAAMQEPTSNNSNTSAERMLITKLAVLGNHQLREDALAVITPFIEKRREQLLKALAADSAQLKTTIDRLRLLRDDEGLGDLGDLMYSIGNKEKAKELYELARQADPDDFEWADQLERIANGKEIGSVQFKNYYFDVVLDAAIAAQTKLKRERGPANELMLFSFGQQGNRVQTAVSVLKQLSAAGNNAPNVALEGESLKVLAEVRDALSILEEWPSFWLGQLGQVSYAARSYSSYEYDSYSLPSYSPLYESSSLEEVFGAEAPVQLERAAELDSLVTAIHCELMRSTKAESSVLTRPKLLEDIRSRLPK